MVNVHNVPLIERPFEVAEEFVFVSEEYGDITIPVGYRTNFADVPRIFWIIVPPCGRYSKATVVHDWLIENVEFHNFTYREINKILYEAMRVLGVRPITSRLIFWSVSFYWNYGRHITKVFKKLFTRDMDIM